MRLAAVNMLDQRACIDLSDPVFEDMVGRDDWQGMDRFEARKKVVATLDALGLSTRLKIIPIWCRSAIARTW